jgi:hypothetical protein
MNRKCSLAAAVPVLFVFILLASGCTGDSASRNGQLPANGGSGFAGCRPGYTNCSFSCVDLQRDVFNCGSCGSTCDEIGYLCQKGVCDCEPGFTKCPDECVDLRNDNSACGSCNTFCSHDVTCSDGECVPN